MDENLPEGEFVNYSLLFKQLQGLFGQVREKRKGQTAT
jgi:hypothetical protein